MERIKAVLRQALPAKTAVTPRSSSLKTVPSSETAVFAGYGKQRYWTKTAAAREKNSMLLGKLSARK